MTLSQDMLEILLGKYMDGEITPAEQRLLDRELDANPTARRQFDELTELHTRTRAAVAAEFAAARDFDAIFDCACGTARRSRLARGMHRLARMRFAAGLAAGLLIGIALHLPPLAPSTSPTEPAPGRFDAPIANNDITPIPMPVNEVGLPVERNVDWYSFTDEAGRQWLLEGYREARAMPAVYSRGL